MTSRYAYLVNKEPLKASFGVGMVSKKCNHAG